MDNTKRKGARSTKDIPANILLQLNSGQIESANLVEWLAIDQKKLLESLLIEHERSNYIEPMLAKINQLEKKTVNTINKCIGTTLFELTITHNDSLLFAIMSNHKADLVRCWATYFIGKNEDLSLAETLKNIKLFAADKHFGVREICWMAVRPKIVENIKKSIEILTEWTKSTDENIRRFATESTRPRGVWCEHIEELKQNPALAMPILELLKSDKAKYVQDSVGNWLNDVSKSNPDFVIKLCRQWEVESNTKETKYIIKKALRTITT
ncbi:MAG: DNA alkylation repair protein [Pseudopedobacter saltans]|uniref:DNA alkylation repair protein n=1 Tax=Pseudopedobacter saltans TaxID=151895 RepID=A0A2W5HAD3_9SPHI|nr:MAG: DNA alkylation repair protein [Pseudopedobacter saltans]